MEMGGGDGTITLMDWSDGVVSIGINDKKNTNSNGVAGK